MNDIELCQVNIQTSSVILWMSLTNFCLAGGSWDIHVPCGEQTLGLGLGDKQT